MPPTLYLVYGDQALSLGRGALTVGRLETCDLALEGREVSRRHARIVATPEGPVLVDRSRFGTLLNDAGVAAPALLADGDRLRIGRHDLLVTSVPWEHGAVPFPEGTTERVLPRLAAWRRRYGVPELVGLVAAVGAGLAALRLTGQLLAGAVAATVAETVCFYTLLALRDLREERRAAPAAAPTPGLLQLFRQLHLEFGAADAVDTLLLRPAAYALGVWLLGPLPGLLAGAALADLVFWGPLLGTFHWHWAARASERVRREHARPTSESIAPNVPAE